MDLIDRIQQNLQGDPDGEPLGSQQIPPEGTE